MRSWFLKRGYPEQIFDGKMENVYFRKNKKKIEWNKNRWVPLVVNYRPKLKV